jgi:hypothetical protein
MEFQPFLGQVPSCEVLADFYEKASFMANRTVRPQLQPLDICFFWENTPNMWSTGMCRYLFELYMHIYTVFKELYRVL